MQDFVKIEILKARLLKTKNGKYISHVHCAFVLHLFLPQKDLKMSISQ